MSKTSLLSSHPMIHFIATLGHDENHQQWLEITRANQNRIVIFLVSHDCSICNRILELLASALSARSNEASTKSFAVKVANISNDSDLRALGLNISFVPTILVYERGVLMSGWQGADPTESDPQLINRISKILFGEFR